MSVAAVHESAYGPKQTLHRCLTMSAFGRIWNSVTVITPGTGSSTTLTIMLSTAGVLGVYATRNFWTSNCGDFIFLREAMA
jgi:hypothetical protein